MAFPRRTRLGRSALKLNGKLLYVLPFDPGLGAFLTPGTYTTCIFHASRGGEEPSMCRRERTWLTSLHTTETWKPSPTSVASSCASASPGIISGFDLTGGHMTVPKWIPGSSHLLPGPPRPGPARTTSPPCQGMVMSTTCLISRVHTQLADRDSQRLLKSEIGE
jgi:hypothetical protein